MGNDSSSSVKFWSFNAKMNSAFIFSILTQLLLVLSEEAILFLIHLLADKAKYVHNLFLFGDLLLLLIHCTSFKDTYYIVLALHSAEFLKKNIYYIALALNSAAFWWPKRSVVRRPSVFHF